MDYLSIGSTPAGEDCAQVGSPDYYEKAHKECTAFMHQLERQFRDEPQGNAYFKVKGFPHDFGTYYEVCVIFWERDEEGEAFALKVENNTPEFWDEEAKKELGLVPTGPEAKKVHLEIVRKEVA